MSRLCTADSQEQLIQGIDNCLSALSSVVESKSKRLRIQFNHSGLSCFHTDRDKIEESVQAVAEWVWAMFGNVTDSYYDTEFSYCFLSFGSIEEADRVKDKLNDGTSLPKVIELLIASNTSNDIKAAIKRYTDMLFVSGRCDLPRRLVLASWAAPRRGQGSKHQGSYDYCDDRDDGYPGDFFEYDCY